jgi:GNAT superfamily N-acetyltransferase
MEKYVDSQEIIQRILTQRVGRYGDPGPSLAPYGTARYRMEPSRLRVGYAQVRPGAADDLVRVVVRFARSRGVQIHWNVVPSQPGESELTPALLAARFERIENMLLMVHAGPIGVTQNLRITVSRLGTWQQMWDYEYGSRQSFYHDLHPSDALVTQRAQERWREQERGWCQYYIALVDGAIVGGCYVSLFEDIPTIMGVYTLAEGRRQGVATALLARSVGEAISSDNPYACLYVEHGNPAEQLYRQLGFVALLDTQTYEWRP